MVNIQDYVTEKLRKNKKVKIEIVRKDTSVGFFTMNWIIDNKFILEDFPFEVFEGEEADEVQKR